MRAFHSQEQLCISHVSSTLSGLQFVFQVKQQLLGILHFNFIHSMLQTNIIIRYLLTISYWDHINVSLLMSDSFFSVGGQ